MPDWLEPSSILTVFRPFWRNWSDDFGDDWVNFRDGIVAAHGWRLEPRPGAQERYDAMVAEIDRVISEGLSQNQVAPSIRERFGEEARASLRRWRRLTGPIEVGAAG